LDKSKEEFQETSGRLEDLNDQILGLRTKNAQLSATIEEKTNTNEIYSLTSDTAKYEKEAADLASENTLLKNSIKTLKANLGTEGTTGATLRLSQLEAENEALKTQIATSQTSTAETTALQAQLTKLSAENEGLKTEMAASLSSPSETSELQAELATLEAEREKLADALAEVAQLEGGNEALTNTINNLVAENEQLKEQVEAIPQYEAGNEALNNSMQTLITENEDLQTNAEAITQYEAGNEVLNATITELLEKNEALEMQLANQATNQVEWSVEDNQTTVAVSTEEIEDMDVEAAKAKLRAAIGAQIPQATSEERDDLKQINGVGPFIEEKLNDLGIYTFEQISQLDEALIETLTNAIEFFPGRIERDDWVGQADRLFYTKGNAPQEMNTTSARMATSRYANATEKIEANPAPIPMPTPAQNFTNSRGLSKPDDLKKIEGIGPKISQILNDAGIYTFSNLSQTPVDRLKSILTEAGNRYKIHNPQTWPQQAGLAATGAWEELKALQDRLDGGRDMAKG